MVVICCFARGQSVFRGLEQLRYNDPDGIELILECVRALGGRHGEMPDGIVIDGLKQFDGFDLELELPASLSGACAVAGLKCMGKTTIADTALLERWPEFPSILEGICEYRK
jgi:5-enolpyruvylshikimate-3-phosphate synthase